MPYYLQHYFDTDFNHEEVRPLVDSSGNADRYNMGYVQNVVSGQILAEIMPLEKARDVDPRYILEDPILPQGPNTVISTDHPQYLLATTNGYVFYHNDLIAVKRLLNVRKNVDFHTGNIVFVNDITLHGDVKSGFSVYGNNVLVEGMVEGGIVRSRKDLVVNGGARGGPSNRCMVSAGSGLNLSFGEKAELRSRGRMVIRKSVVHCDIFSLGPVVVHERLLGGICQGLTLVYVNDLGSNAGAESQIRMGYNPFVFRRLERVQFEIAEMNTRANHFAAVSGSTGVDSTNRRELTAKLEQATRKLQVMQRVQRELQSVLTHNERFLKQCRLVVTGQTYPGTSVTIGPYTRIIEDQLTNVHFFLFEDEIIYRPNPKGAQA